MIQPEILDAARKLSPEEKYALSVVLLSRECERRNEANPELVRVNKNTWERKSEIQNRK